MLCDGRPYNPQLQTQKGDWPGTHLLIYPPPRPFARIPPRHHAPVAFGVLTTDTWRLTPGDPEGREYADGFARLLKPLDMHPALEIAQSTVPSNTPLL